MIYILHLESPLHHAKHYIGFSTNTRTLIARIDHHRKGTAGCRFTEVLREKGINFTLARVMDGDRTTERMMKRTKNVSRYCPICSGKETEYKPRTK